MNQDQVKVLALKFLNDCQAGLFGLFISLLSGGNFAGDVELFSGDVEFFEDLGNLKFVPVNAGCVNVPVSNFKGILEALKTVVGVELVSAVTQNRNAVPTVKFNG